MTHSGSLKVIHTLSKNVSIMPNRTSSVVNRARGCTWCKNAGRSEWRLHALKDSRGRTTCPVLLEILCRTCGKKGHTRKHCPCAKKKKREGGIQKPKPTSRPRLRTARVTISAPRVSGPYAELAPDSSSSEDELSETGTPPNQPVLIRQTNGPPPASPWTPEPSALKASGVSDVADRTEEGVGVAGGSFRFGLAGQPKRSWADSDSDGE